MSSQFPNKEVLFEVANRLKQHDIQFALGGSGMLAFWGCSTEVRDWDITTDAPMDQVLMALKGLSYERIQPNGIFATKYLFNIKLMNTSIDLMGGFAIRGPDGVYEVPTIVTADWDGIPVGSPQAWLKAYELLGRDVKASLIRNLLNENSARARLKKTRARRSRRRLNTE